MENIITNTAFWGALLLFSSSIIIAGWNVRSAKLDATDKLVSGFTNLNNEYRMQVEDFRREISDLEVKIQEITIASDAAKLEYEQEIKEIEARYVTIIANMETKLQAKDKDLQDALQEIEKLRTRVKFLEDKLGTGELKQ